MGKADTDGQKQHHRVKWSHWPELRAALQVLGRAHVFWFNYSFWFRHYWGVKSWATQSQAKREDTQARSQHRAPGDNSLPAGQAAREQQTGPAEGVCPPQLLPGAGTRPASPRISGTARWDSHSSPRWRITVFSISPHCLSPCKMLLLALSESDTHWHFPVPET